MTEEKNGDGASTLHITGNIVNVQTGNNSQMNASGQTVGDVRSDRQARFNLRKFLIELYDKYQTWGDILGAALASGGVAATIRRFFADESSVLFVLLWASFAANITLLLQLRRVKKRLKVFERNDENVDLPNADVVKALSNPAVEALAAAFLFEQPIYFDGKDFYFNKKNCDAPHRFVFLQGESQTTGDVKNELTRFALLEKLEYGDFFGLTPKAQELREEILKRNDWQLFGRITRAGKDILKRLKPREVFVYAFEYLPMGEDSEENERLRFESGGETMVFDIPEFNEMFQFLIQSCVLESFRYIHFLRGAAPLSESTKNFIQETAKSCEAPYEEFHGFARMTAIGERLAQLCVREARGNLRQ